MGDLEMLTKLSAHYLPSHDYDSNGSTLLMYSCTRIEPGQLEITKYLVETLHVDLMPVDNVGRNALMYAVLNGNISAVKYLLSRDKNQLIADNTGMTHLMLACASGYIDIMDLILNSKFARNSVRAVDNKGRSVLHICAINNQYMCLPSLLMQGVNVNLMDTQGMTSLAYAARCGNERVLRGLLRSGAKCDLADFEGKTPLHQCFCSTSSIVNIK